MYIVVERVDPKLENSDETFSFRKQCKYANLLQKKALE